MWLGKKKRNDRGDLDERTRFAKPNPNPVSAALQRPHPPTSHVRSTPFSTRSDHATSISRGRANVSSPRRYSGI